MYPLRIATTNSGSCVFFAMFSRIPSNVYFVANNKLFGSR
jgi:hypothetical protein